MNTKYSNYTTLTYLFLDERKYIGGRIHDCLLALKIQIWYFGILQQENVFFKISRTISMPGVVEYIYPIHRCVVNAAAVSRDFLGLFFCFKIQSWIAFLFPWNLFLIMLHFSCLESFSAGCFFLFQMNLIFDRRALVVKKLQKVSLFNYGIIILEIHLDFNWHWTSTYLINKKTPIFDFWPKWTTEEISATFLETFSPQSQ